MGLEIQVRITRAANPSDILWENLTVRGVCVFGTGCFILEGEKLQNQMIKEGCLTNTFSRWWQLKFLLFAPQKLGRRIHFDYCNICQLGFDFFCCFFRLNNTDHFIPKTSQKYGSSRAPPQILTTPCSSEQTTRHRTRNACGYEERPMPLWLWNLAMCCFVVKNS